MGLFEAASPLGDKTGQAAVLRERLEQVREQVAEAAQRAGRTPDSVTIIGVTKTQTAEMAFLAVQAGLQDLGENYVQEAQEKLPHVADLLTANDVAPPVWHFIGHLQSNKARFATDFDLVQTLDGAKLARELDKSAAKCGKVQRVLIEVNTARMPERAGVLAEDVPALVDLVGQLPHLHLQGLMTIAPFAEDAETVRPVFRQMRTLWDGLPVEAQQVLSMGMSGDYGVAVEEGATHVRLGTALFGPRVARGS